jgi:hypothetical protein
MATFYSVEFFKGSESLGFNVSCSPELKDAKALVKLIKRCQPELKKATVVYTRQENPNV